RAYLPRASGADRRRVRERAPRAVARLTHPAGLEVGRLTLADVPAAAALSAAIDWNQDEADWRRLVELHPEGCVAARLDGELVGTATLVRYPGVSHDGPKELAWLGMVIA